MKKIKYSFIMLMLYILIISLTSCAGTGDWSFSLPNNYEVWRINSNEIIIKYTGEEPDADSIPSFVKEFAYDDRYVFTRNVENIEQNSVLNEIYYVLDTKEKTIYGTYLSLEEMKTEIEAISIQVPSVWYRTSPDPNGA